jgi:hypothetical protein
LDFVKIYGFELKKRGIDAPFYLPSATGPADPETNKNQPS